MSRKSKRLASDRDYVITLMGVAWNAETLTSKIDLYESALGHAEDAGYQELATQCRAEIARAHAKMTEDRWEKAQYWGEAASDSHS